LLPALALTSLAALASFGAIAAIAPAQDVEPITLFGCAVDVRPNLQAEATVKGTTSYDTGTGTIRAEVQLWVPAGVALVVGDYNGRSPVPLSQNALNVVSLSYDVASRALTMSVSSGGTPSPAVALPSEGIFDVFRRSIAVTKQPLRPISETQHRMRLRFATFGISSGFVLQDA